MLRPGRRRVGGEVTQVRQDGGVQLHRVGLLILGLLDQLVQPAVVDGHSSPFSSRC
jgi:hypothetical protein